MNELFWLICGVVGILLELIVPGFVLIFFGVGALITALCVWIFDISTTWQLVIFVTVSCTTLIAFRKSFKQILFNKKQKNCELDELKDEFQGKTAVVLEDFVSLHGKVEFNGTSWKAGANENFHKGDMVFIQKRENLTLIVTKNKED